MGISQTARQIVSAPLDPYRIKQRPGRGGKNFDYIPAEYVIELLNEAFDYEWSSRIIDSLQVDQDILVLLELQVSGENGNPVVKQQYGSSTLKQGVAPGDAYKGAASDALKKCATLLGIALELYRDEPAAAFTPPQKASRPVPPRPNQRAATPPPAAPSAPMAPPRRAAPSRPPVSPNPAAVPVAPPVGGPRGVAITTPPPPRANPFEKKSKSGAGGPNPTQLNALTNLAAKRGVGEAALIALAGIVDEAGYPKQQFDDLSHSEAIQVIQASQR